MSTSFLKRPGDQYVAVSCISHCNTQHQARGGDDAIVGAQYRGAEPTDAFSAVSFQVAWRHFKGPVCDRQPLGCADTASGRSQRHLRSS